MQSKTGKFAPKIFLYPRIRKTPFYEAHKKAGVKAYSVYNHMYHPRYYGDMYKEYEKVVSGVTLWDVSVERQVEITGPDALKFADYLTPRDVSKVKVGQCRYVAICDENGGIISDPVLLRLGENEFWLSTSDCDLVLWSKGVAVNSGMDVKVQEPDVSPVQIQGPKSPWVVKELFGDKVLDLGYYTCMPAKVKGMDVVVSRTGFTAELGYEVFLRDSTVGRNAVNLWEAILEAGRPYGIAVTGPTHIKSLEAGILDYGCDMDLKTTPFEVGLDYLVDMNKQADYVGKAALKRIKAEGVERKLVGLEIAGAPTYEWNWDSGIENPPGWDTGDRWPVTQKGKKAGYLTKAYYSPKLKKNIGRAMVSLEYSKEGTELTVETPAGPRTARVISFYFTDPKKDIAKANVKAMVLGK
ncbi:MAG TPA: glycine cleavage T C-terminal barrel domain-containing protein [Candidatus Dormibacteraeota bacterium]|jgi:aminomethyltransferase|nr:glycine cleavage T C-terminal barrel domain-containing protein [Candidatus Dormibacteraeota bacterium]